MKIKVFFNNSCNICKMEIDHYKKHSDNNLEWVDITNYLVAINVTSKWSAELLRWFHVIDIGESECVAEYKGKIPPDRFGELLAEYGEIITMPLCALKIIATGMLQF